MTDLDELKIVWATREIEYSNRKNCKYLRTDWCCRNLDNPNYNLKNSCRKYLCPIRLV